MITSPTSPKFVTFCVFLLAVILWSCKKEESSEEINLLPESTYSGKVSFPSRSTVDLKKTVIISTSEEKTLSEDGSFSINAPTGKLSYFYADDGNGKTIGMSYQDPGKGLVINDTTTAKSMIMLFPVDWGSMSLTPDKLMEEAGRSGKFSVLLEYVNNIMVNDPTGLMDYKKHPSVLNKAAEIVIEIAEKHGGFAQYGDSYGSGLKGLNGSNGITRGPSVEDIAGEPGIRIKNPTGTPYGISYYNLNKDSKDAASYGLSNIPMYVDSWDLNWWVIPSAGESDVELGDGSWTLLLSRVDPWYGTVFGPVLALNDLLVPKAAIAKGDYMTALRSNARSKALLGTSLNVLARILGIVSVLDPSEATGFLELAAEEGPKAADLIADITLGDQPLLNRSKEDAIEFVVKLIDRNKDAFIKWAKKNGVKLTKKSMEKGIENITVVLDVVSGLGDAVRLGSLIIDSFIADQDLVYTIIQQNGNAQIVESLPPTEPVITGPEYCLSGQDYSYSVVSTDADNDKIMYRIYYGDATSDQSPFVASGTPYTFTHRWNTGSYRIFCSAEDEKGASSPVTTPLKVSAAPEGDFFETFEGFDYGDMISNDTWSVSVMEPSKVVISTEAAEGIKSARFIDFDPDIGESKASYAGIYTNFTSNLKTLETSFMVENIDDAFGIRAWGDSNTWESVAYYIIIDRSKLKWVKNAHDINDETDFIPITQITPGRWYKLKLEVNWQTATYDIFLDNQLVKSAATFVSDSYGNTIDSGNLLQIIAFTSTECRSAYVDNIYARGALTEPLKAKKPVKPGPEKIKILSEVANRKE